MAGIILRFSPASIIASAWSARESEKQVRVGGIIPDEIHASDLLEARFRESVKCDEVHCARSIVPFEGSRWRLRWQRECWKMIGVAESGRVAQLGEHLLCKQSNSQAKSLPRLRFGETSVPLAAPILLQDFSHLLLVYTYLRRPIN
jgi:hypothetical protein